MLKRKSHFVLTLLSLLAPLKAHAVIFDESQTEAIKAQMQHQLAVSSGSMIEEGGIHNIETIYAGGRVVVGKESTYIHTFLANKDNTISYFGKQLVPGATEYPNYSIEMSNDGNYLYVSYIANSESKLVVMAFDATEKKWVEKYSYDSIGDKKMSDNGTVVLSDSGNYLFFKGSYGRWLAIAARDSSTGALTGIATLDADDNIPSRIYDVKFDEPHDMLLVAGRGESYSVTDPLVAYKFNPATKVFTEFSRLPRSGSYSSQSIQKIEYDAATNNIFYVENGNINVYHLDSKTTSLKYQTSTYDAFNTYLSSNNYRWVEGKLLVQKYSSNVELYDFNDGATPSFSLNAKAEIGVDLNTIVQGENVGWINDGDKLNLYMKGDNAYDYAVKNSIADGEQNLPKLSEYASHKVFIETLGLVVVVNSQGVATVKSDGSADKSSFSAGWSELGVAATANPQIRGISVSGNKIFITGRQFSDDSSWREQDYMVLTVAADGTVTGDVKSLNSAGNALYYNSDMVFFDKANNFAMFQLDSGNYGFFSLDSEDNASLIDTLDASLLGGSYPYGRQFASIAGKPFFWDANNSKFYWVDLDTNNQDVDLDEGHDLSGSVPGNARVVINGNAIYFISSTTVSSYKVNSDASLSFMSTSFVANLEVDNLSFVSQDYAYSTSYGSLFTYGIDRDSGSWKVLTQSTAEDYGISNFEHFNIVHGDGLKQQAIVGVRLNYASYGLMVADFSSSPVQATAILPVLANEGEKKEINLADYVFDADLEDVLSFSADNLPADATLSDAGMLTLETKYSSSGDVNVVVTDSGNMTLELSVPYYANVAPLIADIPKYWINPAENIMLNLADYVSDPEGNSFTFAKEGQSPLAVDTHGIISGKLAEAGEYRVQVSVTDSLGAQALLSANIQVNSAPKVSRLGDISVAEGETISVNIAGAFSDADGQSLSYSAVGLPSGLSLSAAGVITGSSTAGGKTVALINATDSMGLSTSAPVAVNVTTKDSSGGGSLGYFALLLLPVAWRRKFH
ncbi:putative Ig domain-containing protein [Shewanella sp. AS16]|uniref:putative Ig domain-containing protein n=1 Tax=Shewanella sp. AS16 TaxID=2907625 RepID=UPI001F229CB7|nr:putative Ig domain-containing protein [Shewanella sp. AS16]MCE9686023.1 putative Ig domain-containing protein [Shewanella sp. AS16]